MAVIMLSYQWAEKEEIFMYFTFKLGRRRRNFHVFYFQTGSATE